MSIKRLNLFDFNIRNSPHKRSGQTSIDYGLGRMKNTIGSTTRIYKHCSNSSFDPLDCALSGRRSIPEESSGPIVVPSVPEPPTILSIAPGDRSATIIFTPGSDSGFAITDYLYSIDGVNYVSSGSTSTPITIYRLTNGSTYTISLKAVNSNGPSSSSAAVSVTLPSTNPLVPLAPVITGVSSKTTTSITLNFTQATNGITITNYSYSLDGGSTFTAFSPVATSSPVTINFLTQKTQYSIVFKATSTSGDSLPSNVFNVSTYDVRYNIFTEVGPATWTAPENVTSVEYLIVGGGGGGGGAYSKINVLGNVLVTSTPQPGSYWINSANLTNGRYSGRMYYGNNSGQNSTSFTDPVLLTASENFTPSGVIYSYQKWYNFQMVYLLNGAMPISTNTTYVMPQGVPSTTYSNNISAGSGGGGGGHIRSSAINPKSSYAVVPGTTYNIYVGAGGAGGTSATNVENAGTDGEASSFDTLVAPGGEGGKPSRTGFNRNGGGGFYSDSIMGGRGGAGGGRNGGTVLNSEAYQWNSTVLRGTYGGSGVGINFDATDLKIYSAGGNGGDPNTVANTITPPNLGKGGAGTGATLNSHANGMDGGSGIVIIKYYVD